MPLEDTFLIGDIPIASTLELNLFLSNLGSLKESSKSLAYLHYLNCYYVTYTPSNISYKAFCQVLNLIFEQFCHKWLATTFKFLCGAVSVDQWVKIGRSSWFGETVNVYLNHREEQQEFFQQGDISFLHCRKLISALHFSLLLFIFITDF